MARSRSLLRAIAVLLVVLGHFIEYSGFHNPVFGKWKSDTDELAHFAVLMFFIHTSLVLMMSLDRLRRSVTDGLIWRFYIRRAARIYPLAISVALLCYGFHIPRFPGQTVCGGGAFEKLSNLLLFQNLTDACVVSGPLWSLPYEVQMYLILPPAYLLGMTLRRPLAMLALGFVTWYVSRKAIPGDVLRFAPWFAMGNICFLPSPQAHSSVLDISRRSILVAGGLNSDTPLRKPFRAWMAAIRHRRCILLCASHV